MSFPRRQEGRFIDWTLSTWVTNLNDSFHSRIHSLSEVRTGSTPGDKPLLQFNKTFCFDLLACWCNSAQANYMFTTNHYITFYFLWRFHFNRTSRQGGIKATTNMLYTADVLLHSRVLCWFYYMLMYRFYRYCYSWRNQLQIGAKGREEKLGAVCEVNEAVVDGYVADRWGSLSDGV